MENLRVLFCCTGVGIFNRGIESFFRDSFDGLKDAMPGIEVRLLKGAKGEQGAEEPDTREKTVWCLRRTGKLAVLFGQLIQRNPYVAEQLSSFPAVVREIHRWKPHVIFYSDSNLGFLLYRFRKQIGVPFQLLFSNGGPCRPPFNRTDLVHQVAPLYLEEALRAGEPSEKHILVPYGIQILEPSILHVDKAVVRTRLGLPTRRPIVLSVGWIAREHKRMHYVIEEVAQMPEPRPFLQLLGAIDEKSLEIIELGNRLLGSENFSARSVPYQDVTYYYQAADIFVLGSLKEGFGRVYLEALMHGLPTIGHCHPVIEYVLGNVGTVADLSQPDGLAPVLQNILAQPASEADALARWESVRDRFSWDKLALRYSQMFKSAQLKI